MGEWSCGEERSAVVEEKLLRSLQIETSPIWREKTRYASAFQVFKR